MENVRPFKDNVFVRLDRPTERTTDSGIIVKSDTSEFGPGLLSGVVVAAGPGGYGYDAAWEDKPNKKIRWFGVEVEEGERVLFGKDRGDPLHYFSDVATSPVDTGETEDEYRVLRCCEIEIVVE